MARKKDGKTFGEVAIWRQVLIGKWMAGCETAEAVLKKMVAEQLINIMPAGMKVWLLERNPKTGS